MPRGPKGEKRPADVIGTAMVARIAAGETEEKQAPNSPAAASGQLGGKARAKALGKKKRVEIARKAAKSRWSQRLPQSAKAACGWTVITAAGPAARANANLAAGCWVVGCSVVATAIGVELAAWVPKSQATA